MELPFSKKKPSRIELTDIFQDISDKVTRLGDFVAQSNDEVTSIDQQIAELQRTRRKTINESTKAQTMIGKYQEFLETLEADSGQDLDGNGEVGSVTLPG
ncbi:hypothetical protein EniLVp02_0004 [Vibrio phage EniLVp02]